MTVINKYTRALIERLAAKKLEATFAPEHDADLAILRECACALLNRIYGDVQGEMEILAKWGFAEIPTGANLRPWTPDTSGVDRRYGYHAPYGVVLGVQELKTTILTPNHGYPNLYMRQDDPWWSRVTAVHGRALARRDACDAGRQEIADWLKANRSRKRIVARWPWAAEILP